MPKRADKRAAFDQANGEAAWIILNEPERYQGGCLEWAEAWVRNHGAAIEPVIRPRLTFEERLKDAEERAERKRIEARRARWRVKEWHTSRRGNSYCNVNGFLIVVFRKRKTWAIGISERDSREPMEYSRREYSTREAALAGAFDALIYRESKRGIGRAAGFSLAV